MMLLVGLLFLAASVVPAQQITPHWLTSWASRQKTEHETRKHRYEKQAVKAYEALEKSQRALELANRLNDKQAAQIAKEAIQISSKTLGRIRIMQQQEEVRVASLFSAAGEMLPTDLPRPEEVPGGLIHAQAQAVQAKQKKLMRWRRDLIIRIQTHNQNCTRISDKDWGHLGFCHQSKGLLTQETEEYRKALRYFGDDVRLAGEVSGVPQPPAPRLDPNTFTYFLWDQAENDRTMLDLQLRLMVSEANSRSWPGPQNPHERLVNPLDEDQARRDRELLKPLNHAKVQKLTLDQVAQLINARTDARIREASRNASRKMHNEMRKLEQEGILRPGESVLEKEKRDPHFRKRMQTILTAITREEIAQVRAARGRALEEMQGIVYMRQREGDADRQQSMFSTQRRVINELERDLDETRKQTVTRLNTEMERLRTEGYYRPGDDLEEKYRTDPRFQKAVNEVLTKAVTRKVVAERRAQDRALQEMQKAVKDFLGE